MTDIRDATPIGEPRDDSGGFCCVSAGMHMGHDEDCPATCPNCGGHGADPMSDNVNWLPCKRCNGTGRVPVPEVNA